MKTISRRAMVRLVSFTLAVIFVLAGFAIMYCCKSEQYKQNIEYQYLKSISNLSYYLQNMDSDLTKAMYVNSPEMLSTISAKLLREAGYAKMALSGLPIEYLQLQNTNKLLSQIGDYCVSLSKDFLDGREITDEQRTTIDSLHKYCTDTLAEVLALNDAVQTGSISLSDIAHKADDELSSDGATPTFAEGFAELDAAYESYPSLIYDGPFSDHIMQKKPLLIKGLTEVARHDALAAASKALDINISEIRSEEDEQGKMPSYCFVGDNFSINVTKAGGYVSYMLKSRTVAQGSLSEQEAIEKAEKYLANVVTDELVRTYYEISDNIMTINYAGLQESVTLYTDLIKISVAMDNGEILGFDARGYITNHTTRQSLSPTITTQEAKSKLSPRLTTKSQKLCVIPSDGQNELLCYEFNCTAADGKNILVYINAANGKEERILILSISENGQLVL